MTTSLTPPSTERKGFIPRNRRLIIALAAMMSAVSGGSASRGGNPWAQVPFPTTSRPESIGNYDGGCLRGAETLELSGAGYEILRPSRRRYYAHPRLAAYIKELAAKTSANNLGKLMIGDVGQARGGPTMSAHLSHQTGLDVDIMYRQIPAQEALSPQQRENFDSPSMVRPYFGALNENWNPAEISVLRLAAENEEVDRIFVNPSIKREICKLHQGEDWLRMLRPNSGHDDHFHIRLKCAEQDTLCKNAKYKIPPGDGCGENLTRWFTPASIIAEKDPRRRKASPRCRFSIPSARKFCANNSGSPNGMIDQIRTEAEMKRNWISSAVVASAALFIAACSSNMKTAAKPAAAADKTALSAPAEPDAEASSRNMIARKIDALAPVYFEFNQAGLDDTDTSTLKQNAEWLKVHQTVLIQVAGNCDQRGTVEYNLALGQRRAKAVRDYYIMLGIEAKRVATISYGKERTLCAEANDDCYSTNRRAETLELTAATVTSAE